MAIDLTVKNEDSNDYPIWSYIQMGFNEKEYGFQDGSHSTEWTFDDCVNRIKELGISGTTKLLAKKTLWLWSEGTYQAQRFGFGDSQVSYIRDNAVTSDLRKMGNSIVRNVFENMMKGQYYVYVLLALLGVIVKRKDIKTSLLFYIFAGYFCFYLIWEIKSRYIYSLYPYIILFAYIAITHIEKYVESKKSKLITKQ